MTDNVDIEATRVRFNDGQFDTNFQYIQTAASGTNCTLLAGHSIAIADGTLSPGAYRFQVGSYTVVCAPSSLPTPPASVPNWPVAVKI